MGQSISIDKIAELSQQALPLMASHGVPATPENYHVWFKYLLGEDLGLNREIDHMIANGTPFDAMACDRLYQDHRSDPRPEKLENKQEQMREILREVGLWLSQANKDTTDYHDNLDRYAQSFANSDSLKEIRGLLHTLIEETREMQQTTSELNERLATKNNEITTLQEELKKERTKAATDSLTGLANRATLLARIEEAAQETLQQEDLCLIMVDIDHFKHVNDSYGHLIGDRVIRFVAKTLTDNTKGKDIAARYGGEEFAILLPRTTARGAQAVAENIRKTIAAARLVRSDNKQPLGQITVSAGIATYHLDEDIMEFVDRADRALYASKNAGRNQVTLA